MSTKKKERICFLVLIIIGLLFFYKTIYFGFINIDDPLHSTENIAVRNFDLKGLLLKCYIGLYHPLTTLSFAIDWWLGSSKPWMFHLSNMIFHIFATLVLLKLSLKLWPKKYILGFLISLTFLIHPLKAESVAWITERKDVLSGLFLWLTIYIYLFYLEQKKPWQYILAFFAFLFAVASKVSVVFLPIFLFVIDWYKNKKLGFTSLISKAPFFIIALIFGLVNVLEQARMRSALSGLPVKNYTDLLYQTQFYIQKAIFPWSLRAWYSIEFLKINLVGIVSIGLICLLAILILTKYTKHKKDLLLGLSLFSLFLFPNLRLLPKYSDVDIVHDRYMYIALVGLTIAFFPFILHLIEQLWRKGKRFFSLALSGFILALITQWFYLMYVQITYWKSPVYLWQRTAILEPNTKLVAGYYGDALFKVGSYEEALSYLKKSFGRVEDYELMGSALNELKRGQEAENIVIKGLELYPSHSLLLNMLGVIKYDHEQYIEALALFAQALRDLQDDPGLSLHSNILNNLGLANMRLGYYKDAESFYRQALAVYKNNIKITHNLGLILLKQNHLEEARGVFLRELKLNSTDVETYNAIGAIFYLEKNYTEARIWFNRSITVDPNSEAARSILVSMDKEMH